MPYPYPQRAAQGIATLACFGWLAVGSGCAFGGFVPKERVRVPVLQEPVVPLAVGQTEQDLLDCPAGDCQTRFRLEVERSGELQVQVSEDDEDESTSLFVTLQDPVGNVVAQDRQGEGEVLRVAAAVEPGPYVVLVRSIGGRVPYAIETRLEEGAATAQRPVGASSASSAASAPETPPRETVVSGARGEASSAHDPDVSFRDLETFAFAEEPQERLQAEPGSKVGNPFVDQAVQRAIRNQLVKDGFEQVPADQASFLVDLHVGSRSSTWYSLRTANYIDAYDSYFDNWASRGAVVQPHTYQDGTLVIDIIDPKSGKLIWHGWSTESVPPRADQTEVIKTAVARILAQFPPTT